MVSFSLRLRRIVVDAEMHDVVQVSDPCVGPIFSKLRFPASLNILPSVPDWSKCSIAFYSTPQCVSSVVVMLLPQIRTAFITYCGNLRCAAARCLQDFEGFSNPVHYVLIGLYLLTAVAEKCSFRNVVCAWWALNRWFLQLNMLHTAHFRRPHGWILCWTPSSL